jgi:hypothetical protein
MELGLPCFQANTKCLAWGRSNLIQHHSFGLFHSLARLEVKKPIIYIYIVKRGYTVYDGICIYTVYDGICIYKNSWGQWMFIPPNFRTCKVSSHPHFSPVTKFAHVHPLCLWPLTSWSTALDRQKTGEVYKALLWGTHHDIMDISCYFHDYFHKIVI